MYVQSVLEATVHDATISAVTSPSCGSEAVAPGSVYDVFTSWVSGLAQRRVITGGSLSTIVTFLVTVFPALSDDSVYV